MNITKFQLDIFAKIKMKGHIMIKSLNPKASGNVLIKKTGMGCLTAF